MKNTEEEREVEITSLYFRSKQQGHCLVSYPKQMIYEGLEYTFLESSMQYLVRKGQQLIRLFDVSDGNTAYRLRLEDDRWTLVSMKATV